MERIAKVADEVVVEVAARLMLSEYEIFNLAYRSTFRVGAPRSHLDACFESYLRRQTLPAWVDEFCARLLGTDGAVDDASRPAPTEPMSLRELLRAAVH